MRDDAERTIAKYSDDEARSAARALSNWKFSENALRLEVQLAGFDEAMRFIAGVADIARDMNHHPELYNVYDRVRVAMTTHDAGGVTRLDFEAAKRINALLLVE